MQPSSKIKTQNLSSAAEICDVNVGINISPSPVFSNKRNLLEP